MRASRHSFGWHILRAIRALTAAAAAGGVLVYLRYRQDIEEHEARIAAGSTLLHTPSGTIEYAEKGGGQPVLALHGAGGGYDQGMTIADLLGVGFRVVAPSRFGYLNTPIPADASVSAQADAYVCLLDRLNLKRVTVIAFSAGGPSALYFAHRYPERVDKLVLISALSTLRPVRDDGVGPSPQMLSDFGYWAMINAVPELVLDALGVPAQVRQEYSPVERERALMALRLMLPMARRNPGNDTDIAEQNRPGIEAFPLAEIRVPTLVIHAKDDTLVPFAQGEYSATHVPGAQFIAYEQGGHLVMVKDEVWSEVRAFIKQA
jgi:2-hydroxy-6-oxonona-2,4-dienedioate hydrolase